MVGNIGFGNRRAVVAWRKWRKGSSEIILSHGGVGGIKAGVQHHAAVVMLDEVREALVLRGRGMAEVALRDGNTRDREVHGFGDG